MAELSTTIQISLFLAGAVVILLAGSRLAIVADRLADRTGLGEALTGALLLGAATSLPGTITSALTAWNGYPSLAYSNAIGGIAAQTVFLVAADAVYRKSNLEHAAVSITNITSGVLLVVMLAMMLAASAGPDITVLGVHPVSVAILLTYAFGLRLTREARDNSMWAPRDTKDTHYDRPDPDEPKHPLLTTIATGLVCLVLVAAAGWLVAETGTAFTRSLGLSESVVGTLFTSVATSLPELVTTIVAVRVGALQLAVGGIIGGNAFDTLFVSIADGAYRDGSIYHAIGASDRLLTGIVIIMTGVLLLGLLRRQQHGLAGIGSEGWTLMALYALGVAGVVVMS